VTWFAAAGPATDGDDFSWGGSRQLKAQKAIVKVPIILSSPNPILLS
jgi:hypothetical protein